MLINTNTNQKQLQDVYKNKYKEITNKYDSAKIKYNKFVIKIP